MNKKSFLIIIFTSLMITAKTTPKTNVNIINESDSDLVIKTIGKDVATIKISKASNKKVEVSDISQIEIINPENNKTFDINKPYKSVYIIKLTKEEKPAIKSSYDLM